ncbi:chromosome segregation protein SMC [Pseudomonas aeruginosa]|nr:chromosome segregation protein SMC [Pseudomonas aeruginosa]
MRLKSIKLAGFKSFVDPTTVNFPSNMAAVVGPNGCGKSNIIDAVRWVMGESSAKNLRGESMTDVIFNGSNTRKPVSQASIELIFDNAETTLVGEYAQYAEISIRRRVSRDGQNTYFLNGTKCRRRDITDIFLGTGLGPRSYSIIEQGMISKLIEARPEDLRNFIEEAAGISKYKERRRETESRIRRTQENLARLTDLREELGRQLERLHRQAQSAEKYQEHKAEERQLKAQLGAVRWRDLNEQVGQRERVIGDQEIAFEALVAEQRGADAGIERLRDGHHELSERFNQVQARFYSVGGDIARVEQSIQHGQQRQRQLQDDLREAERTRQETESHLGHDRTLLATLAEEMAMLAPEQELSAAAAEEAGIALEQAEQGMQAWQQQWDAFNQQSAEPRRQAEVQQSRIQHLEQSLERLQDRERRLQDERGQLAADPEDAAILELNEQVAIAELALEELQLQEQGQAERLEQLRQELQQLAAEQHQAQGELQRLNGRIASLEALQQAARPRTGCIGVVARAGPGTTSAPRRRLACRAGLGTGGGDRARRGSAGGLAGRLRRARPGRLRQGRAAPAQPRSRSRDGGRFAAGQGPRRRRPESLAGPGETGGDPGTGARPARRPGRRREPDQPRWLLGRPALPAGPAQRRGPRRHARPRPGTGGVAGTARGPGNPRRRGRGASGCGPRRAARAGRRARAGAAPGPGGGPPARRAEGAVVRAAGQGRATGTASPPSRRRSGGTGRAGALEQEQLSEARLTLQEALDSMALDTERRETLLAERDALRERLDRIRQDARTHKDHAHQLAVRVGSLRAQHNSTQQALERLDQQSARLNERCEQLNLNLEEGAAPLEELRMKLEELLERRMAVEDELKQARLALEDADRELREVEKRRGQAEQQSQLLRGQLEQQRLEWQGLVVRRKALQEQLAEDGYDLHTVLANLPLDASEREWEERLESLAARIQRLGPINLAAIEEYQQQSERKRYLDSQNDDLAEALETLENVIRKIDRETRNRFKETFDQINAGLQALFPKVFGGGTAYLELTGEDLLDTGVAIMARPPGKKNSTIHLLSGGEKALTALALVFAIFQLNPAPFCMLDEVDAPLDDANVGRYARLVKEMSEKVQFIYITHNKIAMEMADQLMGVTMHEPGCSRLVAVDVEEAVALAEA